MARRLPSQLSGTVAMPGDIGIVDLMIGFPTPRDPYHFMAPLLRDEDSRAMAFPAEYMFTEVPQRGGEDDDPVATTLGEMDRHGVAIGLVGLDRDGVARRAVAAHPDRFRLSVEVDPNDVTGAVRRIREDHAADGVVAVSTFPAGCNPQVPVSDAKYYPVYQTCIDLDLPIIVNAGIAGPRVPSACQHVEHFDRVCYDFPELRIVMRHGAEPWVDLAVKLMLKWPGLYYMTSAFAPRYYPRAVLEYANTRGAEKVMYAGYYPMGLSLERIVGELADLPLRDHVWPRFLRENALDVFRITP